MSIIEFKDFNFKFQEGKHLLKNINIKIEEGEFVLINGPSGSGKTTLLSNLKKEFIPKGEITGSVSYKSKEIRDLDDITSACDIGYMFQNPDAQIVTDTVIQEIAFPLENIGTPTEEIRNRIAEMVSFFGLKDILHKNVNELSGGQKQLVNLCSLLVLKPKVLILDEPTSQLNPIASYDFLTILRRLNEEFSITVLLTDYKSDNIYPFVDKVIFLYNGEILANDKAYEMTDILYDSVDFRPYLPDVTNIYHLLKEKYPQIKEFKAPLSVREGRRIINSIGNELPLVEPEIQVIAEEDNILTCKNTYFGYTKENVFLKNVNIKLNKGDFIGLIGGNGAGKSTLLQIMAGIMKPIKGKVKTNKNLKIAYVHQNPMIHLGKDTVKEEIAGNSDELIELFNISHILDNHPFDCSGGEMQKIAILKALSENPDILILDEPSKGLDPISRLKLAKILSKLQSNGLTIIMSNHDLSFVSNTCNRCMMLFDGAIQIDSSPRDVFSNNNFYTTFVNRIVKEHIPDGIVIRDLIKKWSL